MLGKALSKASVWSVCLTVKTLHFNMADTVEEGLQFNENKGSSQGHKYIKALKLRIIIHK